MFNFLKIKRGNKPCPPSGPAHDGRGKGVGMPKGSRKGRQKGNRKGTGK